MELIARVRIPWLKPEVIFAFELSYFGCRYLLHFFQYAVTGLHI